MRILFCQTGPYLPQEIGGGLCNTDALCRALVARQCEVMVLCQDKSSALDKLKPWARKPITTALLITAFSSFILRM